MTAQKFRLIYGLPGAGKTSLCRELIGLRDDIFFADMGASPDFGEKSMFKVCAELFLNAGEEKHLLTEACLPQLAIRDGFVTNVLSYVKEQSGTVFDDVLVIYLDEDPERLHLRRRRTAQEYSDMKSKIQEGSKLYKHEKYNGYNDTIIERVENIGKFIS